MYLRKFSMYIAATALYAASAAALPMPILDARWDTTDSDASGYTDHIDAVGPPALNVGGAYAYALSGPAMFRITDVLNLGDIWIVYDFGVPILTTVVQSFGSGFGDNVEADSDWMDAVHSKGEILLGTGPHALTVSGNGSGGLAAHYFARIDSVPEPATLALLSLGLAGLGFSRRRKLH